MIEFLCPEGHRIRCPKEKAGRPAKCPKCGVGFRIPTIEELGLVEPDVVDSSLASKEASDVPAAPLPSPSGVGKQSAVGASAARERQIEFLCPNGHHLHGPANLQGRAGECPECGSRFRIPIVDEPQSEPQPLEAPEVAAEPHDPADEEITLENPTPAESEQVHAVEPADFYQILDGNASQAGKLPGTSTGADGAAVDVPAGVDGSGPRGHPLAALFSELWAARGEGSRVEIHLDSGSVLSPDGYSKSHSQRDYAVLVTRDPDGLSTVTVVPWSSIARIIVRAVKQVPGEVVR